MTRSLLTVVAAASDFEAPTHIDAATVLEAHGGRIVPLLASLDSRPIGWLSVGVLAALLASDKAREAAGEPARFTVETATDGRIWAVVLSDWLFDSPLDVRTAEVSAMAVGWRDAGLFDLKRRASSPCALDLTTPGWRNERAHVHYATPQTTGICFEIDRGLTRTLGLCTGGAVVCGACA